MHLALALDVSPLDLLLPERTDPGAHPITGATPRQTRELWAWATEGGALTGPGATMRWQVLNTLRTTLERQSREHTERMTEIAHWQRLVRILTEALHADDGARGPYLNQRLDQAHQKILDDAVADRRVLSNSARGVKLPRRKPRPRVYLTHEQVHALARESKSHQSLILVLAYCGLRWGETTGLRVGDVDLVRRRLTVEQNAVEVGQRIEVGTPKTHARRTVPFPGFLRQGITEACARRAPGALLFPGTDGMHLKRTRSDVKSRGWFAGAVKRSGVPHITPHDLRHTAASIAVSAGANVKAVQRMLGHASAAMTLDIYADLFDDDLDAVSDALHRAVSATSVGNMWATGPEAA